jgi:uncharacterized protein (DUF433 family)
MARYPLNLPQKLKQEAEGLAKQQGVSLNQFILWATAEKVGSLKQQLDDPEFPHVTYRRGTSGSVTPIIRGTGIRVQTLFVAATQWQLAVEEIAEQFGLSKQQVVDALAFAAAHRAEIEQSLTTEAQLENAVNA